MNSTMLNRLITKYISFYCKVGQELKTGVNVIIYWDKKNYKVGQAIYYKVGQSLLQTGAGIRK